MQFGKEVSQELAAAFAKRSRNCVATDAVAAGWSAKEFVAMVRMKTDAMTFAKRITDNLSSGAYSCLKGGKAVRPSVQVGVAIVETFANETSERILQNR